MRGVHPSYNRDEKRGERETHLISGIHGLSRGEEPSYFIKVTILGSVVDGPSGRAHDETRGCCSTNTHHAAGTSGLNERLRARGEVRAEGPPETEIERASGGEKKKIGLMAGKGGESGQPWVVENGRD
jgi:hypothetical protein